MLSLLKYMSMLSDMVTKYVWYRTFPHPAGLEDFVAYGLSDLVSFWTVVVWLRIGKPGVNVVTSQHCSDSSINLI